MRNRALNWLFFLQNKRLLGKIEACKENVRKGKYLNRVLAPYLTNNFVRR